MKKGVLPLFFAATSVTAIAQREFTYSQGNTTFTMKRYIFMLLNAGETRSQDSIEAANIQEQHWARLNKLSESGKPIVAGPFKNGEQPGCLFRCGNH